MPSRSFAPGRGFGIAALLTAALVAVCTGPVAAQTNYTGGQTSPAPPPYLWNNAANWDNGIPGTTSSDVVFATGAASATSLATTNNLVNLTLNSIAVNAAAGPVSIAGNGFTLGAGGITIASAGQPLTIGLTAGQAITLASGTTQTWAVNQPQTLTVNSPIVGDATTTLNLTGPGGTGTLHGIVQLNAGSPSFAGNLTIGGPNMFVVVGADNSFGTGTVTTSSFNTAPQLQSNGGTRTIANAFNWTSGFAVGGTSNWVFNGPVKFTGDVAGQTNRTLNNTVATTVTMNGAITMGDPTITPTTHNRSLTLTTIVGGNIIINGVMQDPTSPTNTDMGLLTKNGAGPATLNNPASTYSGATALQNGILEITLLADQGTPSSLGTGAATPTITLGSTTTAGTLRYIGTANSSTNRQLQLLGTTGGGTLDSSGTGTMSFTNATFGAPGAGTKTFTLTGTNTGLNTIAGVITNNSPANITAVSKTGVGTWNLTGANTYTGATIITGGTLLVNNTTGSGTGAGAVTVNGTGTGAAAFGTGGRLGGTGIITPGANGVAISSTTAGSQGGILSPGNSIGTLAVTSLTMTWSPGGQYAFEHNVSASAPIAPVGGTTADFVNGVGATLDLGTLANTGPDTKFQILLAPATGFASATTSPVTYTLGTFTGILPPPGIVGNDLTPFFNIVGGFHSTPSAAISGNSVTVTFTPVPEPAHVLLACGGLAGLAGWRRKWRTA